MIGVFSTELTISCTVMHALVENKAFFRCWEGKGHEKVTIQLKSVVGTPLYRHL